jgi:hypothetical protein
MATIATFTLFLCHFAQAQEDSVESGLFTLEVPVNGQYVVSRYVGKPCPVKYPSSMAGDIIFKGDSIECHSGIQYDSTYDSIFKFNQSFPQTINIDKKYLFDIIFKKNAITAPIDGYKTSVPYGKKLYFIRRPDSTFAAFTKIGDFIGGIDKSHYYLISSSSKSPVLHKRHIQPYLESLQFYAHVFSGRPDPMFAFTDSSSVIQILEHTILSMYTNKDSASTAEPAHSFLRSGFRGFSLSSLQRRCDPVSSWAASVTLSNGYIRFNNEEGVSRVITDTAQSLERLIVSLGIKDDLTTQDSYGTIRFKDLFKTSSSGSPDNKRSCAQVNGNTITVCFTDHKYVVPYYFTGSSKYNYIITSLTGRIITSGDFDRTKEPHTIHVSKQHTGMAIVHIWNETDNVSMYVR